VHTNGQRLMMRSAPSINSRIQQRLPNRTRVEVISTHGRWHRVQVGNRIGFVHANFIRLAPR
jgi:uncharacterized protein YgiM (DUF1202 family)